MKYLIYGGVASGAMIYGMSWLFGLTGSDGLRGHRGRRRQPRRRRAGARCSSALVLVLAGFGYKIAAVPFHMWAPDVYTGAPLPVTTFLAVGSKAAGFAMLLRFFAFGVTADGPAPAVRAACRCAQLLVVHQRRHHDARQPGGALADEREAPARVLVDRARRLRAPRPGRVPAGRARGRRSLYLATYYLMNLGAFSVVMLVAIQTGREDLDGYRGLAWRGGARAGGRAGDLPVLARRPAAARGLHRQVLRLRRGHPGRHVRAGRHRRR